MYEGLKNLTCFYKLTSMDKMLLFADDKGSIIMHSFERPKQDQVIFQFDGTFQKIKSIIYSDQSDLIFLLVEENKIRHVIYSIHL